MANLIPLLGTALGAGVGLLESRANRKFQEKQNARNQAHDHMMYSRQREDANADWHRTNAYNSPQQQMQRLREAGLNPNLVYGKGADNTAAMVRSSSASSSNGVAPKIDYSGVKNALGNYQTLHQQTVQTDNLKAQADLIRKEGILKDAQAIHESVKGKHSALLYDLSLEAREHLLNKIINESRDVGFTADIKKLDWQKRNNEQIIHNQAYEMENWPKLKKALLDQATIPSAEKAKIEALTEGQLTENKIKEAQQKLMDIGIQPNDPLYLRLLSRLIIKYQ